MIITTDHDSALRQLVSELKDQRIVKTYCDSDNAMHVALVLSPSEIQSALLYFGIADSSSV